MLQKKLVQASPDQITMPEDFRRWQDILEVELGGRFNRLFRGPAWSGLPVGKCKDPMEARMNVACISSQAVNKDIVKSGSTATSDIQESAIKDLKSANPKGRFWIKVDGTDIKPALQESKKGEWNGDPDLQDSKLEQLREEYDKRVKLCNDLEKERGRDGLQERIQELVTHFEEDTQFLQKSLQTTVNIYQKKIASTTTSEEKLKELSWEIVELSQLIEQSQQFAQSYDEILSLINPESPLMDTAISRHKVNKDDLRKYTSCLFKKKRQPAASHVLVIMVSDEERNHKPYALPIQYVPYASLKDQWVRDLTRTVKEVMTRLGLSVVGTVTDGEFSSLRTQGESRPLHIWQLIHDARDSVSRMKKGTLKKMLVQIGVDGDGNPVTELQDCIPAGVIGKLHDLQEQDGLSFEDALHHIRKDLVYEGYTYHSWKPHVPENEVDMLRSVVATYRFRARIGELKEGGVDFSSHLYVPEIDPTTGNTHHEREDHNHILKRIAKHTRDGGHADINVRRFDEAYKSNETDLTFHALVGTRKQSVGDAERLLSHAVANLFRSRGYEAEADYVKTVADWHEASDGRGLSQAQRRAANQHMRDYILDQWMPWHRQDGDLSRIDVNRRVEGLCGFSRETVIGITTNIESQEARRRLNDIIGFEEHPRAATTDDVECFFALLHHKTGGQPCTLKEFKCWWRKLVMQFRERMDNNLPFYYWTLNERYTEEAYPSFDVPPENDEVPRLHRLRFRSREDSSIIVAGRTFLPVKNRPTLRQSFHKFAVGLPPVNEDMQQHIQRVLNNP
ncbi:uncharacterized protein [Branchiostoma lanceolatum]|uniref:uncharacterized protein n=1 Tax=Branchiostoma lanceolatum TaxID=7740 RepID=UPI003457139C